MVAHVLTADSSIEVASQGVDSRRPSTSITTMKYHLAFVPAATPVLHSNPLTSNLDLWTHELQTDLDKNFLLDGISKGFHIIDNTKFTNVPDVFCKNC